MINAIQNLLKNKRAGRIVAPLALLSLGMAPVVVSTGCTNFGGVFKMSKSQEIELGQQSAKEVEAKSKIVTSGPQYERLQRVAARILPLARHDYDVPFSVKLIQSKEINAFALPGGPMFVNRGMIEAARNEGEMAGVMAHEISHVALRHATAQQTKLTSAKSTIIGLGSILGGAILGVWGGEIMTQLQLAMMGKVTCREISDAVFAHPTLGESLNNLLSSLS